MTVCTLPDPARLHDRVRATYERVAASPQGTFHFAVGPDYAVERLHYSRAELAALPATCTSRFAGVGNPLRGGTLARGATVLDHACGAGTDLLLAARRVGPAGRAIGVDLTPAMQASARAAAREGFFENVEIRDGAFEALPVDSASVDAVLSNGVLNLAIDKPLVLREVVRVLRPGGQLLLADVVLGRELAPAARADADLWAACVGGALTEEALLALVRDAGFTDVRVVERYDAFANTRLAAKFGRALEVGAVTIRAALPR